MSLYTSIHLHNVAQGCDGDFANWFDGPHREELTHLRGFKGADRYEITLEQVMSDILQPLQYMSVYEFYLSDPVIDIPALGLLLAKARRAR